MQIASVYHNIFWTRVMKFFSIGIHKKRHSTHNLLLLPIFLDQEMTQFWTNVNLVNKTSYTGHVWNSGHFGIVLLVVFVKHISSQLFSHCIHNCISRYILETVKTFDFWQNSFQNLHMFFFFIQKTAEIIAEKLPYFVIKWL